MLTAISARGILRGMLVVFTLVRSGMSPFISSYISTASRLTCKAIPVGCLPLADTEPLRKHAVKLRMRVSPC
ncbi:MAG: hypothetical protein J3Q66DRAFT_333177 [Benniella sp.]|nr:MAG: hypothetical protein J3Q66DRAFT_333177 [Benniella sp.]